MRSAFWTGTGRRLFVAFAAMIGLYAAAAGSALYGLVQIHDGLMRARERTEGLRVALELESAVRDQYAHIAHTVIIGDRSHLKLYDGARDRVRALNREMAHYAADDDEHAWVAAIERDAAEMDTAFREQIVPSVVAGRGEAVQAEHQRVLSVTARIQDTTSLLARRFSESVAELQALVSSIKTRAVAWTILFLMIAPALAAAAGIVIGRSVARPIARLTAGAERIAAGDLDTRIDDVGAHDEFGALAQQFNAMAASIREHQRERVQSEKLASIGRLAAGVAHEINNPLGVILGYVRVMKKAAATAGLAEDLDVVEAETLRCKEIVDGLLQLSRPINVGTELVDLREVVDDVVARLAESELSGGVTVAVDGSAHVRGDALRLRQVVFNLIKNAIEAAAQCGRAGGRTGGRAGGRAGGRVAVRLGERDDGVELVVTDSGPGFAQTTREHLFEPFYTSKEHGTGLGLAVSRAIVLAHDGELVIEGPDNGGPDNGGPDNGARVVVRLPRARRGGSA